MCVLFDLPKNLKAFCIYIHGTTVYTPFFLANHGKVYLQHYLSLRLKSCSLPYVEIVAESPRRCIMGLYFGNFFVYTSPRFSSESIIYSYCKKNEAFHLLPIQIAQCLAVVTRRTVFCVPYKTHVDSRVS